MQPKLMPSRTCVDDEKQRQRYNSDAPPQGHNWRCFMTDFIAKPHEGRVPMSEPIRFDGDFGIRRETGAAMTEGIRSQAKAALAC